MKAFATRWFLLLPASLLSAFGGCAAMKPIDGVPVSQVSRVHRMPMRNGKQRINLSLLRQPPQKQHKVDAGDVLGIYIDGVLGGRTQAPPVNFAQNPNSQSSIGYPVQVREDGTISLPLAKPIPVRGLTIPEVEQLLRTTYTKGPKPPVREGRDRILVTLQRPRHYRVLVIREEAGNSNDVVGRSGRLATQSLNGKRGAGRFISLPAYKNDVMHALAETGGLPGLDAENVIYIIRRRPSEVQMKQLKPMPEKKGGIGHAMPPSAPMVRRPTQPFGPGHAYRRSTPLGASPPGSYRGGGYRSQTIAPRSQTVRSPAPSHGGSYRSSIRQISATSEVQPSTTMQHLVDAAGGGHVVRIPLRVYPGEPLPFSQSDIILEDGDVVLIEPRDRDVFFTGGLLGGGRYQLPRDRDIDVIEALVMVQSSLNRTLPTRSIGGIASTNQDVTTSASDMIILRPNNCGGQTAIRVNLYEAVRNPCNRIYIRPGDHLILQYTKTERIAAIFERHILDGLILGISSNLFFNN